MPDNKDDLMNVDNLEINALDDKELDSVAGGYTDSVSTTAASCSCCASGATLQQTPSLPPGTRLA